MSRIRITIIHNRGYIFHADDYVQMRRHSRIVGTLVGCALACPRNTNVNGLPAVLTACELRLLLDQQLADILPMVKLSASPHVERQAVAYRTFCEQSIVEQQAHQRACKLRESRNQIDRIVDGKRAKMLAAGATAEECAAVTPEQMLHDIGEQCVFQADNALRQVPTNTTTPNVPRIAEKTLADAEAAAANGLHLQYRVFADLWRSGKYVTVGDTFGGDFLIYPGDPMMYHASHIVHCVRGPMTAAQLVAAGRLSVLVNKLCVFAYLSTDGELAYQTLEWEGNNNEADA